jgi:Flp pilus assembly protein TadB
LQDHIDSPLVVIEGGLNSLKQQGLTPQQGQGKVISLERQVRIAAGLLVLIGVVLGTWYSPWFYALSGFVGAGLTFAGVTDTCAMGMALARMPWNGKVQ